MELRRLQAFVAVAEGRNFTRSATRLHLAQSGLSATIRLLERELQAPLFRRTTTMLDLVQAGCGISVLPEVIAALRPELHRITIKCRERLWTIAAQVLAPEPPNPAARALWNMLAGRENIGVGALQRFRGFG